MSQRSLREWGAWKLADELVKTFTTMAFFKKPQRGTDGKWYASAVTVAKPMTADKVNYKHIAISTVPSLYSVGFANVGECLEHGSCYSSPQLYRKET